jgi:LysR family transcriptional regulator, positive regulator for ilvC
VDYDVLRLFLHLSRTLHFGRTSKECHVSASALSRAVQRLEEEVGRPLLERDRRKVALTPDGARFADHARETLERWGDLQQALAAEARTLTGTISIFASVTACQSFLPAVLAAFRLRYPDIHIALETGYAADALDMVEKGKVEVAVAALPDRMSPSIASRVLLYTPLEFVAPASSCDVSRLVARSDSAQLAQQGEGQALPWAQIPIVLPATGLARTAADRWFKRRRIRPLVYSEVSGSEAILSLVALGCGVGIVPRLVIDKSPLRAEVRPIEVSPPVGEFQVGLCTLKRKLRSPIIRAFWESTGTQTRVR